MNAQLDEQGMCHLLGVGEFELTQNAKITVGFAVKHIASVVGLDESEITKRLSSSAWYREEDKVLMLVLEFEDDEAVQSMFVEIPADHWKMRGSEVTQ